MGNQNLVIPVPLRDRWVSAGGVVFDTEGLIALVLQRNRSARLRWTFPKGRVEPGETNEAAALREVGEEAGLSVRIARYLGVHESPRSSVHYFAMRMLSIAGPFEPETVALRFVAPDEAGALLVSQRDVKVLRWALQPASDPSSPWLTPYPVDGR